MRRAVLATTALTALLLAGCASGGADTEPADDEVSMTDADASTETEGMDEGGDSGSTGSKPGHLRGQVALTTINIESLACMSDPSMLEGDATFRAMGPTGAQSADGGIQEATINAFDPTGEGRQNGDGMVVQISVFDMEAGLDLNLELAADSTIAIQPPAIAFIGQAGDLATGDTVMLTLEGACGS
ncbi:hypothetical protein ACFQZV_09575 [Microbacterium koreense]|uniref:Lipoprotein n=1 Tax=Microbacterium koreense TaxID=323761 RepID=A0ABW2ZSN2_9MICO